MGEPGALLATFPATTRVRSTTRPSRLLVPSASTEDAFVKIAGATMAVSTANGLLATTWYCMLALPFSAAHPSRQNAPQTTRGFLSYQVTQVHSLAGKLLRVLLDGRDVFARELHKDRFVRRMPIDPILGIVAVGVTLAHFAVRLPNGRHHFLAVHAQHRMALRDGLLHFRRQRVNPVHRRRPYPREIQERPQYLFQLVGSEVWHRLRELHKDRAAHSRLEPWGALVLRGSGRRR